MRRTILAVTTAAVLIFAPGCGNLSPQANPKLEQKLDNQNGKIGEIDNLQNSMKAEIGKLQTQADIQNSKLDRLQMGLMNLQQNNDNHGVQILSGSGGLVLGGLLIAGLSVVLLHYRSQAKIHEKTADVLAEKVVAAGDPKLEDAVFEAVVHTPAAANMLRMIKAKKAFLKSTEQFRA